MIRTFENYTNDELTAAGVLKIGNNVRISSDVIIHNPHKLRIGDNVRIDTQCVLVCGKEGISIGNNVHIGAGCYYYGNSGAIILEDYTCTSAKCCLYTANDDYTNGYAANSCVDEKLKKLDIGSIILNRHVLVGCQSIILPGVTLAYGTSVGSHSLVKKSTERFDIVAGNPAKVIGKRKNIYLNL
jgi:acetyltransferase-like isoleucine patch superfamily enzyme